MVYIDLHDFVITCGVFYIYIYANIIVSCPYARTHT